MPNQAVLPTCESPDVTNAVLYLASASPRRRELLAQLGLSPRCLPQDIDESVHAGEAPAVYVERLARAKALAARRDPGYAQPLPILAADTTVACGGVSLGKPRDAQEAQWMLERLQGTTHEVLTGIAVATAEALGSQEAVGTPEILGAPEILESVVVVTRVRFRPISAAEIAAYWASGEPRDKAGAYAIQGLGAMFVSHIEGSYSNVVGLPLYETLQLLNRHGIASMSLLRGACA